MHNFLCQNVRIFPLYIAYKKNSHILVWGYQGIFGPKNHTRKINKIHNLSCIVPCPIVYCKHVLKAFLPLLTRFYYLLALSTKASSISFFSSFGKPQSQHLVGCYDKGISAFLTFFKCFAYIY